MKINLILAAVGSFLLASEAVYALTNISVMHCLKHPTEASALSACNDQVESDYPGLIPHLHVRSLSGNGWCEDHNGDWDNDYGGVCQVIATTKCNSPFSPEGDQCVTECPVGSPFEEGARQCKGAPDNPQTCEPINFYNGHKYREHTDYTAVGTFPLQFVRYYNSQGNLIRSNQGYVYPEILPRPPMVKYYEPPVSSAAAISPKLTGYSIPFYGRPVYNGHVENKWRHNYDRYLAASFPAYGPVDPTTTPEFITIYRPDGKDEKYKYISGSYQPQNGYNALITHLSASHEFSSGWKVVREDLTVEYYSYDGKLLRLSDGRGNDHNLVYNDTILQSVSDSYGHSIQFFYENPDDAEQLTRIVSPENEEYAYSYTAEGLLDTVTYPDSGTRSYLYEDARYPNALTGIVTSNNNRYSTYIYDDKGRAVVSALLKDGSNYTYSTDVDAVMADANVVEATRVEYSDGETTTRTLTNALGRKATYTFDDNNQVSSVDAEETVSGLCAAANRSYTYYADFNKKTATDWEGNITEYSYYTDNTVGDYGLLKTRTEAKGTPEERVYTFEWDATSRVKTMEKLGGWYQIDYTYVAGSNRLDTVTKTDLSSYATENAPQVWSYSYTYFDPETEFQVKTMSVDGPRTDITNDVTTTEYTTQGYVLKTTNGLGHVTEVLEHTASGLPQKLRDPNGVISILTYTQRNWLDTVTIDNGDDDAVTNYDYDLDGNLTDVYLANGVHLSYDYDSAHRLNKVTDGSGAYIKYTLDAAGNITHEAIHSDTATIEKSLERVYDELSRLRKTIGSTDAQETTQDYDLNDNLSQSQQGGVNGNSPITRFYDALARIKQIDHEDGGKSYYAYSALNQLTEVTDQRGLITTYDYDGLNNLRETSSPGTGITTYEYDAAGNRKTRTDARSIITTWTYDALNRLRDVVYSDNPEESVSYSYDDKSNGNFGVGFLTAIKDQSGETLYRYNQFGQMIDRATELEGITYQISFGYDKAGQLTAIQYPNGRTVNYARGNTGNISSITTIPWDNYATTETIISNVAYKPFGPLASYQYGSGGVTHTIDYDTDYRSEGIADTGNTTLRQTTLDYFVTGNIQSIADDLSSSNSQTFTYDQANRLDTASGHYGALDFDYDAVGNRTQLTVDGNVDTSYSYAVDANRLESLTTDPNGTAVTHNFTYSDSGNLKTDPRRGATLTYNAANRLEQVTSSNPAASAEYVYNALGQRVIRLAATPAIESLHYHYGLDGKLLAVTNALDGSLVTEYVYLDQYRVAQYRGSSITDTDNDGMDDEWEIQVLGSLNEDGLSDSDNDGVNDYQEFAKRASLLDDLDDDGITDGWEWHYFGALDADMTADHDGDGITSGDEFLFGYSPTNGDQDSDGLSDGWEYKQVGALYLTKTYDSDGDGMPDYLELTYFDSLGRDGSEDLDLDSIGDLHEVNNDINPRNASDAVPSALKVGEINMVFYPL